DPDAPGRAPHAPRRAGALLPVRRGNQGPRRQARRRRGPHRIPRRGALGVGSRRVAHRAARLRRSRRYSGVISIIDRAAAITSPPVTLAVSAARTHASNSGFTWGGPKGPPLIFTGMVP